MRKCYTSCQDGNAVIAVRPYSGRRGARCQASLSETLDVMGFPEYGQGGASPLINKRCCGLLFHGPLSTSFLCSGSDG